MSRFSRYQPAIAGVLAVLCLAALGSSALAEPEESPFSGPIFQITSDAQVAEFVLAIGVANATITIAGNVNLDLTGKQDLLIARGVQIIGDRRTYPAGPRIFTTSVPTYLFDLGDEYLGPSDGVRISGIRLDGRAGNEASNSVAVSIRSSVNIEIDNSEFSGWGRSAVEVVDPWGDRISLANAATINVHDNYLHDNQEPLGYGVVTGKGAYALIEKNVFYNNRHSVAGDGSDGSGYLLYRNLILANTGFNQDEQQIDMHGQNTCPGGHYNCGPAGEYLDIRYNAIQHIWGRSLHLRGRPDLRADVAYNVFALSKDLALLQNEGSNLREWGNTFSLNTFDDERYCDFDGDGRTDRFMATGVTWWYKSSLVGRWTYLNQSAKRASGLSLADADNDGRCDIAHDGTLFKSGTTPVRGSDVLWRKTDGTNPLIWQVSVFGQVPVTRSPGSALASTDQVVAAGDFDGDGDSDVLTRGSSSRVSRILLDNGVALPKDEQAIFPGPVVAGVGDFDGDGADDVLWRRPDNHMEIWFSGMAVRAASPSHANDGGVIDTAMQVTGIGDFNGDRHADILWRNTGTGWITVWLMNGATWAAEFTHDTGDPGSTWAIPAIGDFDGDKRADILWRSAAGQLVIWLAGEPAGRVYPTYSTVTSNWIVRGTADFNADGRDDIFWDNTIPGGQVGYWTMNGGTVTGAYWPGIFSSGWKIEGLLPLNKHTRAQPPPGGNTVLIPDLTGYSRVEAISALHALGLVAGQITESVDPTCNNDDQVTGQIPGSIRVPPGTSVRLYIGIRPKPPAVCH